ncbi:hypothetical protein [Paenibacillus nasutitermitis]|uniref:Uncharacterized protein n=1 Tax=Paenibacillus nasutitermitis TaxID=1652958 RepID=A0A917DNB1_9BACL|nr:hypothetical protein [Paenibacillus nasutitermitis]GGD51153.1 hypothetical protein GCM10010911_05880 [Paenibacillus nasutitermitis]
MKKKWLNLPIAALMLAAIVVPQFSLAADDEEAARQLPPTAISIAGKVKDPVDLVQGLVPVETPLVKAQPGSQSQNLAPGSTLGQDFLAVTPFTSVGLTTPGSGSGASGFTFKLYKDGPSGTLLFSGQVSNAVDGVNRILVPAQEEGRYYAEITDPTGNVGWLTQNVSYMLGSAYDNGQLLVDKERVLSIFRDAPAVLGQTFSTDGSYNQLIFSLPAKAIENAKVKASIYYGGRGGQLISSTPLVFDKKEARLQTGTMPAGTYYIELVNEGAVPVTFGYGKEAYAGGDAYLNGSIVQGKDLALSYMTVNGNQLTKWDTKSDTWAATDALGRTVSTSEQVGPPRKDKFVGLFYFLWLGYHDTRGPFNITEILAQDPNAMNDKNSPLWGPLHDFHYWAEPLFGYYRSDDEYVIRKHAQMLSDADVDTIIFDVTNQFTYKENYMTLLRVFTEIRNEGGRTPQVAFLTPFGDPSKVVKELYNDLYGKGLYSDLWFQWEGKPLILADPALVGAEQSSFFTFRKPQPDYFVGPTGPNQWGWLEDAPQHVFLDSDGNKEQMVVGVAQNAVNGKLGSLSDPGAQGRSYHNESQPAEPYPTASGLNAAEQWERALAEDPEFIFITGWNEWIAMRFDEFNNVKAPVSFVDQFTQEFSRDIEPMKGGHADSFYYQMADYIRKFKGAQTLEPASKKQKIKIDGNFNDWKHVSPEYKDDIGDTAHRNHPGTANAGVYTNTTGRNDIILSKMARDNDNVYFYVQTHDPITPYTDTSWMNLFINTDGNGTNGWNGYDVLVNASVVNNHQTTIRKTSGAWNWQNDGNAEYKVNGNEMEIAIPRAKLGLTSRDTFELEFKWVDNRQKDDDIVEFTVSGDSAPNDRFNYRYKVEQR